MTETILLCADGSELSTAALATGRALLAPDARVMIVTVVELLDPLLVTGTGLAGGTMSPEAFDAADHDLRRGGESLVTEVKAALGLQSAETRVLRGDAGFEICRAAADLDASAIVIGTRGRGGFKRAVLGSVSDHVVRTAPCPVVVVGPAGVDAG